MSFLSFSNVEPDTTCLPYLYFSSSYRVLLPHSHHLSPPPLHNPPSLCSSLTFLLSLTSPHPPLLIFPSPPLQRCHYRTTPSLPGLLTLCILRWRFPRRPVCTLAFLSQTVTVAPGKLKPSLQPTLGGVGHYLVRLTKGNGERNTLRLIWCWTLLRWSLRYTTPFTTVR